MKWIIAASGHIPDAATEGAKDAHSPETDRRRNSGFYQSLRQLFSHPYILAMYKSVPTLRRQRGIGRRPSPHLIFCHPPMDIPMGEEYFLWHVQRKKNRNAKI